MTTITVNIPALDRMSATFKSDLDAFFLTTFPAFAAQANALAASVNDVSTDFDARAAAAIGQINTSVGAAADSAALSSEKALAAKLSAESAAAISGADNWDAATTYAIGDCAWSPADYQTYRRKIAGASPGDPSTDSINWQRVGGSSQSAAKLYYFGSM